MPRPAGVILHGDAQDQHSRILAIAPGEALAPFIERHWLLHWDLAAAHTVRSALVPALACNLTREVGTGRTDADDEVVVTGVPTSRFDVDLVGRGFVIGTKFHPGAFAALTGIPARRLTNRTLAAEPLVGGAVVAGYRRIDRQASPGRVVELIEPELSRLLDRVDDEWLPARDVDRVIRSSETITSVADLVTATGYGERALQRLFARYIGVTPKQAIARYRLQDAVAALDADTDESLADLAVRLGFFDQAHLAREFRRFVGIPPSAYRAGKPVR